MSLPIPSGTPAPGPFGEIAASVRALVAPSPALYYAVQQERVREHRDQLATLDVRLEEVRKRAFAAGVRLMSIRKRPEPVQPVEAEFAQGDAS